MLRTTEKEREHVESYVRSQLPTHGLELAQKLYSERVHAERHDIWDVHTQTFPMVGDYKSHKSLFSEAGS
jgi:hypothetical protein